MRQRNRPDEGGEHPLTPQAEGYGSLFNNGIDLGEPSTAPPGGAISCSSGDSSLPAIVAKIAEIDFALADPATGLRREIAPPFPSKRVLRCAS